MKRKLICGKNKYLIIKKKNEVYPNCYDIVVFMPNTEFHFLYYSDKKITSFEYYQDKIREIINKIPIIPIKYGHYSKKLDNIGYEVDFIEGYKDPKLKKEIPIYLIRFYESYRFLYTILFIDYHDTDNFRSLFVNTHNFLFDLPIIKEQIAKSDFQIIIEQLKEIVSKFINSIFKIKKV
jgi:hypothetical protein